MPNRIDGDLHHCETAVLDNVLSIRLQPAGPDCVPHLGEIEARPGDRNGGTNILSFGDLRLERSRDEMTPGIERYNAPRFRPLRKRTDRGGRIGVRQIGTADRIERTRRDCQRAIERIGPAMAAYHIAALRL